MFVLLSLLIDSFMSTWKMLLFLEFRLNGVFVKLIEPTLLLRVFKFIEITNFIVTFDFAFVFLTASYFSK